MAALDMCKVHFQAEMLHWGTEKKLHFKLAPFRLKFEESFRAKNWSLGDGLSEISWCCIGPSPLPAWGLIIRWGSDL